MNTLVATKDASPKKYGNYIDPTKFIPLPENPDVKIARVTERSQYRRCRRQWNYAFREELQPRELDADARTLGTAVHAALAAFYTSMMGYPYDVEDPKDACLRVWADYVDTLDPEQFDLGTNILHGYFPFAEVEDKDFVPEMVEQTLYAPASPGVYLQGTMDLIVRRKSDSTLWILDHKTYRTFLTPEQIEFDDQLIAYIWLARQNGIPVRGAYFNQLRKKVPTKPLLLKNGTLSKNKNIDSDKATYLAEIRLRGFDPKDYADILEVLPDSVFYKREPVIRTNRQLDSFQENLFHETSEMHDPRTPIYPSKTRECIYCDFKQLCRVQEDKGDVENMKQFLYVRTAESPNRRES